ncbi:MAG: glutathione S-transferase [Burkholderiales bacterium]|nr:glutathione S-transferase [Burkholderiales bacterium]
MKLYYSPFSPYTRKCLVAAHELNVANRIEVVAVSTGPTTPSPELLQYNPLCKLPTLVVDDGVTLYDSRVICEYLNEVGRGSLLPTGALRWDVLVRQALADGILDAALSSRYEDVLRPAEFRWNPWREGQMDKVRRAISHFEAITRSMVGCVDLGTIALGSALAYLDLRFADIGWRNAHPQLAAWFGEFERRPSMQATRFGS